ncbi:uncharacterized protein LOC141844905 [Curcuma longa]|uniref:uncharacterized protein LOC141844905 n=1 Tax=Curcuma longa TaxID=136217 RepID=UPI003D9E9D5A
MESEKEAFGGLVWKCIEAATLTGDSVDKWRRQRRTLERLPSCLADALFRRIVCRRLLRYPSWLENFQNSVENIDLRGENSVSAEWLVYLGGFHYLSKLNLSDCKRINDAAIWYLAGMDNLKELHLSRCSKISDSGIKHLISIQSLEKLHISEIGLTSAGVNLLSSLSNLDLLDLGGIPVTDEALLSLQVLKKLEYLDLWGSKITNKGIAVLATFPKLSFLNLAWTKVTKLPYLPSITRMNMSNCNISSVCYAKNAISDPLSKLFFVGTTFSDVDEAFSMMDITNITYLNISRSSICNLHFLINTHVIEHLDLSFCGITDDSVEYIAKAGKNLKCLNANNTKLTSEGVGVLAGNVINLETLCLSKTLIDDIALSYISMMPSLRVIDLSHTKIKGFAYENGDNRENASSLSLLQNLSRLESLNLEDTLIQDEALHSLCFLKQLNCLYLKSHFLSDVFLHSLSSLSKLKFLGYRDAVLTNSGLFYFMPPKTLRVLDLRGCWLLSEASLSYFHEQHPQIELRRELVGLAHSEGNVSTDSTCYWGASPTSDKISKVSRLQKSCEHCKVSFVDERIKYSKEELLAQQFSSLSTLAVPDLHMLPKALRSD